MFNRMNVLAWITIVTCASCADAPTKAAQNPDPGDGAGGEAPTLRSDITPITRAEDAQPGVFIPPYLDCRAPKAGETGASANGQVCTPVAISGCTEVGKYFPDYASCDVVRTQRPYWPAKPAGVPKADDPRLQDATFMKELGWVTEQARASACSCCHDSTQAPMGPSQWYIDAKPIWTDTVSDSGIALFTGLADSSIFGAFEPKDNNGFQRATTGIPSTDGARMKAFFLAELQRRGITEEQAAKVPPFGGFLYTSAMKKPEACVNGEGVDASGRVNWDSGQKARYVFILDANTKNPGTPPNNDLPPNTLWRLDVLASADALSSGVAYGTTPKGSFQSFPVTGRAPKLEPGKTYHIFSWIDVALVGTNCLFTYSGT